MVILKAPWEIERLRVSNQVVARALDALARAVKPGITTRELDRMAEDLLRREGAAPAFKGYRGYPFALCASVNEEVVHGMPSGRALREGDIVSLDLGAIVDGYYGDGAVTVPVGSIPAVAERLLRVTVDALERGVKAAQRGARLGNISHAVQTHVERHGYSVVRTFVGHGIGKQLHEEPQIPNFGPPGRGPVLLPGMVLAIEPMVTMGGHEVRVLDDGWTAVTTDGSLAAHFEHTIAVTESGPEVLTALNGNCARVA